MKQQCFLSSKNQKKQLLNFQKTLWVSYKMETQKIINLLNISINEEQWLQTIIRMLHLKIAHHFLHAKQINDMFVDTANHIYIAMSYTIWLNIVIIIQIHQEVYGSLKGWSFC